MKYWFKRRRYGYGWIPVSWQGWLLTIGFVALVIGGSLLILGTEQNPPTKNVIGFITFIFVAIAGFVLITRRVSPAPKWRWGKQPNDEPSEDW